MQVICEKADPDDPNVGLEHAEKGWPRGLSAGEPGGLQTFMSYTLIDPDDPETILKALKEELA